MDNYPCGHVQDQWKNPCSCELDEDSACKKCPNNLWEAMTVLVTSNIAIAKASQYLHDMCGSCHKRYIDYAVARMLPMAAKTLDRSGVLLLVKMQFKTAKLGNLKLPLTIKAWKDVCAEKGWNDALID